MQLLQIDNVTTLTELTEIVGSRNIEPILAVNQLRRRPDIGAQFQSICNNIYKTQPAVSYMRKQAVLNTLTSESDIFEATALLGEQGWKVASSLGTLPGMLRMPESIYLPDSVHVMGNHLPIGNRIYREVMESLAETGTIDPGIFNEYAGVKNSQIANQASRTTSDPMQWFKLPWGQITLYSSLSNESIDIPVYPEELADSRVANYTQMPDMLYQYEPWQVYQSSGPRSVSYTFKIHRDMWTGDHTDGKAAQLVRFCEANCYPEYNGSAVNTSTVTLYIAGSPHITGVMTSVNPSWSGPIGHDGWYLYCDLEISITEVAASPLNYSSVKSKGIIS